MAGVVPAGAVNGGHTGFHPGGNADVNAARVQGTGQARGKGRAVFALNIDQAIDGAGRLLRKVAAHKQLQPFRAAAAIVDGIDARLIR